AADRAGTQGQSRRLSDRRKQPTGEDVARRVRLFPKPCRKDCTLKLNNKPNSDGWWEGNVKPIANENGVRDLAWINANRKKVEEATNGRIGYMHVPDTAIPGVIEFDKALNAQLDKEGIIVDERDNSGGQIPDFYTEKLKRQLLAVVASRDTKDV